MFSDPFLAVALVHTPVLVVHPHVTGAGIRHTRGPVPDPGTTVGPIPAHFPDPEVVPTLLAGEGRTKIIDHAVARHYRTENVTKETE